MKLVKDYLARLKANAYSIGARYGKTVKLSNGTYIEPQAQLSYIHFGGDSFKYRQHACRAIWCEQYSRWSWP